MTRAESLPEESCSIELLCLILFTIIKKAASHLSRFQRRPCSSYLLASSQVNATNNSSLPSC